MKGAFAVFSFVAELGFAFAVDFVFEVGTELAFAVYFRLRSLFVDRYHGSHPAAYACAYAVFFCHPDRRFDRLGFADFSFLLPYLFQLKKQSLCILFDLLFKLLQTDI